MTDRRRTQEAVGSAYRPTVLAQGAVPVTSPSVVTQEDEEEKQDKGWNVRYRLHLER